jgi:hypothetical protein
MVIVILMNFSAIPDVNVRLDNTTVEKVDYNERFHWNSPWAQGRIGFGPFG